MTRFALVLLTLILSQNLFARDLFQCVEPRTGNPNLKAYFYTSLEWGGEKLKADVWEYNTSHGNIKLGTFDCYTNAGAAGTACSGKFEGYPIILETHYEPRLDRNYVSISRHSDGMSYLWCEYRSRD